MKRIEEADELESYGGDGMNKERTAEYVRVMQAYLDGKAIQYKSVTDPSDGWDDNETPCWQWHLFDYRIKPQPRIIYVNERCDRGGIGVGEDSPYAVPYVRMSDVELLK